MMQIFVNIIITSCFYLSLSLASFLAYSTEKYFNIVYAGIIVASIYFTHLFKNILEFNFFISSILSIVLSIIINTLIILFIFQKMKIRRIQPFSFLIASLGIYIILIGLIGYFFGYESIFLSLDKKVSSYSFFNSNISLVQSTSIISSIILFIIICLLYYKTTIGTKIRAISSNPNLSLNFGINSNRISLTVNVIAAFIFSFTGILIGLDTGATPNIGFELVLYGIIVMIISGMGKLRYLVCSSLLLATVQHLAAYFIDTKWMQVIAYVVLILFLVWKPLGFSGKQLKKIEI